jgi:hypothetical protein
VHFSTESIDPGAHVLKRASKVGALLLVVALTFVKIFPFSGQIFAACAAVAVGLLARDGRARRWFSLGTGGWRSAIAWGVAGAFAIFGMDALLFELYPFLGIAPMKLDRFAAVRGNAVELIEWLAAIWLLVAVTEELISRAFLVDQWLDVLPTMGIARAAAVVLSALTFAIVHFYEGLAGTISNFAAGAIFGVLYLLRGRTLGSNVVAHGLADSMALIAIYLGLA